MAKKVYLITRRGLGYRVSKSPPGEGEHGVQLESENGIAWDASEIQGGGVPVAPAGFAILKGADGAYLKGADGAYLYGKAA